MKKLKTEDLDAYVQFIDTQCSGNLGDKKAVEKFLPIELIYHTAIDHSLSPFSDEYFQLQIDLYEEIAGKQLDQASGELHPVNISLLKECPNPIGTYNVSLISEQSRAIMAMLSLSCLRKARRSDGLTSKSPSMETIYFLANLAPKYKLCNVFVFKYRWL